MCQVHCTVHIVYVDWFKNIHQKCKVKLSHEVDIFKFVLKTNPQTLKSCLKLILGVVFKMLVHCVWKKRTFYLNTERQNSLFFFKLLVKSLTVSRFLMTSDAITTTILQLLQCLWILPARHDSISVLFIDRLGIKIFHLLLPKYGPPA